MNLILLAGVLLQCSVAFAIPSVGDYAKYKVKVVVNGHVEFDGYETRLLKSFDPVTRTFLQVSENGGSFILQPAFRFVMIPYAEKRIDIEDLSGEAYLKNIVSNCENDFGGTTIQYQVSDRLVPTCKQTMQGNIGTTGMAVVPFGWVFFHYSADYGAGNHADVDQELIEFGFH